MASRVSIIFIFYICFSCGHHDTTKRDDPKQIWEQTLNKNYPKESTQDNLRALEATDQLINIDSTNSKYYFVQGYCYSKLGYYPQANESINKSLKLGFDRKTCLVNLFLNSIEIDSLKSAEMYLYELKKTDFNKLDLKNLSSYLTIKKMSK